MIFEIVELEMKIDTPKSNAGMRFDFSRFHIHIFLHF